MTDSKQHIQKDAAIARRLQKKLLAMFEQKLDAGELTAGEVKTLTDLLVKNGWTFDPSTLPQALKDKLTENVNPEDLPDPEDYGIRVEA